MALESTQPLTEMSTRSISWGKGVRCVRLTTLPPSCAVVMKSGNLNFLEPSGPLQACNRTALPNVFYSCEQYFVSLCRQTSVSVFVKAINLKKKIDWIWNLPVLSKRLTWKKNRLNLNSSRFVHKMAELQWWYLIKWTFTVLYCYCTQTHVGQNLLCFCICHHDDDLVEFETCGREMSDKWLFIVYCAVCRLKYSIITLLHGM